MLDQTSGATSSTTFDSGFILATQGSVGKLGGTGNLTEVSIMGTNVAPGLDSVTITQGHTGEEIDNVSEYSDAYSDAMTSEMGRNKAIQLTTALWGAPAGEPGAAFHYQASYLTLGSWQSWSADETAVSVGFFAFGDATLPANIPTTGSATYVGGISGATDIGANVNAAWGSAANMTATADFAARSINLATTGTIVTVESLVDGARTYIAAPELDMSGTLTYSHGDNLFSGAVHDARSTGTAQGRFFGPHAEEIGGVFTLGTDTVGHTGVFAGGR